MQFPAAAKPSRLLIPLVSVTLVAAACGAVADGAGDEAGLRSVAVDSAAIGDPTNGDPTDGKATTDGSSADTEVTEAASGGTQGDGRPATVTDAEPAPGSSDPDPALSPDPGILYPADTCYVRPIAGQLAEEVDCQEPHTIEVYASADLPGGSDAPYQGLDAAFELCGAEFLTLAGIGLNLATVFERSVLRPSEKTWAQGERTVTCYVVYPAPTVAMLSAVDPVRSFGRVSVFGLASGDCLATFDETASWFDLTSCDEPHEAEVFIAEWQPETGFPGEAELDVRGDELCFGEPFETFVGRDYASSSVFSIVSVPTAETWEQGDRTINCILTDDLVRSRSFEGTGL